MTLIEKESRQLTREINRLAKKIQKKRYEKNKVPLRKELLFLIHTNQLLKRDADFYKH